MAEKHSKKTDAGGITPQHSDLEALVGYNLKRAYVIVQSDFRRVLGSDGLSTRSFSALSLVVQYPNITQSELARYIGIERSGLVAIVDDLESRDFVARVNVPGDRRIQALVASEKGKAVYTKALVEVHQHEQNLLSHLTHAEKQTLMTLLKKIRQKEKGD